MSADKTATTIPQLLEKLKFISDRTYVPHNIINAITIVLEYFARDGRPLPNEITSAKGPTGKLCILLGWDKSPYHILFTKGKLEFGSTDYLSTVRDDLTLDIDEAGMWTPALFRHLDHYKILQK